ncbi:MAG: thioredoxin family protein [bacterium]
MRKNFFTLAMVFLTIFVGCNTSADNGKTGKEKKSESVTPNNEKPVKGTIQLTKEMFIEEIMDYESNPNEWVFKGDKPCVIDFYADWCGPCRITSPILEEIAVEYAGKINVYKVDTEKQRELAAMFGIQSIPSFLYCPMEGKPSMHSGIAKTPEATKEMFREQINQLLLE